MARDIEEFLKRAAERRRQQQQQKKGGGGGNPPPRQRQEPPRQRPPRQQRPPQSKGPPKQTAPRTLVPEVVDDPYATETIAEHVRKHISTDDVADVGDQLGSEVANRDNKIDDRIHQKFDHQVGQLKHKGIGGRSESVQDKTTSVTEADVNQAAQNLVDMLRNPETVVQSIVVSEILKRPNFD